METRSFDPYVEGEGSGVRRKVDVARAAPDAAWYIRRGTKSIWLSLPFVGVAGYAGGYYWSSDNRAELGSAYFAVFLLGLGASFNFFARAIASFVAANVASRDTNNTQNKDNVDGSK